ncbi:DUF86 domain-containing protein [Candidatus Woesearchaeota archaeon]|nr:DUF86 domain-containing protein [Candidatus Woesearchaeota archaeon]
MKKDEFVFIEHMSNSIKNIEQFVKGVSKDKFEKDIEKQYAVIRAIEIIGEAVKNISPAFRKKYPKIPWAKIAGMRDRLIHHYFGVRLDRVWEVVKEDIPELKKQIQEILESLDKIA